jgi:hypothetical protein
MGTKEGRGRRVEYQGQDTIGETTESRWCLKIRFGMVWHHHMDSPDRNERGAYQPLVLREATNILAAKTRHGLPMATSDQVMFIPVTRQN